MGVEAVDFTFSSAIFFDKLEVLFIKLVLMFAAEEETKNLCKINDLLMAKVFDGEIHWVLAVRAFPFSKEDLKSEFPPLMCKDDVLRVDSLENAENPDSFLFTVEPLLCFVEEVRDEFEPEDITVGIDMGKNVLEVLVKFSAEYFDNLEVTSSDFFKPDFEIMLEDKPNSCNVKDEWMEGRF